MLLVNCDLGYFKLFGTQQCRLLALIYDNLESYGSI